MAERSYDGNLAKTLTAQGLGGAGVQVADPLKVDAELREIFKNISHGDPTGSGIAADGNFGQTHLCPVTTPAVAGTEFAVEHGLGKAPVGFQVVVPMLPGYKTVDLTVARAADATYAYFTSTEAGATAVLRVW